jgi:RND superfamily putative drug exporter
MALLLSRLGRFASRRRWAFLAAWLVVLLGLGAAAVTLSGTLSSSFSIPGTPAQQAMDALAAKIPVAGGATGRIVFAAPTGHTLAEPGYQQAISEVVKGASGLPDVVAVIPPSTRGLTSLDGRIGYAQVQFAGQATEVPQSTQTGIADLVASHKVGGLDIAVGGAAVRQAPSIGSTEGIGVIAALVVLLITFGSVVAAGLPMLTALIGVGVGMAGILTVSGFVQMSSTAPILALMLGLAVGIDYALFIVSRHRSQLKAGMDVEESIARAAGTAGSAVLFAGLTVLIALGALSVVGIPFLTIMGLAAAATVGVAVLIALTLLPALLGFAGEKVLRRKDRAAARALANRSRLATAAAVVSSGSAPSGSLPVPATAPIAASQAAEAPDASPAEARVTASASAPSPVGGQPHHHRLADLHVHKHRPPAKEGRWIRLVTKHPVQVLVAGVIATGLLAIPLASLHLGLPDDGRAAPGSTKRQAYDLLAEGFGPGFNGPLIVTVEPKDLAATQQDMQRVAGAIAAMPNVVAAIPAKASADGSIGIVQVIPGTGPSDVKTETLVHQIRSAAPSLGAGIGASIAVTGQTALQIDVSDKLATALPIYLAIVVGLALILLLLVFRSIIVPIKAALGFLITIGVSFGAVVAVYQWGWLSDVFGVDSPGPIVSFLPILLIGVLFGLAMDYEVFLVSGMRESFMHSDQGTAAAKRAVRQGFSHGSRVVTAAAIIMTSVFFGFVLAPDTIIASIGFALGVGVLVDAFLVRMTLVPAAMTLLGRRAWYLPRWLDRILPNVDVEGAALVAARPGGGSVGGTTADAGAVPSDQPKPDAELVG